MLTAILLDDAAWTRVSEARHQEWRLAIREILDEHVFRVEHERWLMRLSWTDDALTAKLEVPGSGVFAEVAVPRAELDPLVREYADLCRELSAMDAGAVDATKLTVLDQAKRDTHDAAGKLLARHLDVVGPTHDTARKLFTLLVVLWVDTTQLSVLLRPHGESTIVRT